VSIASTFGAPVKLVAGDKTLTFPLLSMRQIAELVAQVAAEREAMAVKLAKAGQLKGESLSRFRAMVEGDDIDLGRIIRWAETPAGAVVVLTTSLGDAADAEAIIDSLPGAVACDIAVRVLGWQPPAREGKQPENPSEPAGESTGGATDGSSSTSTTSTPGG
jgi:hypothetical protein